MIVVVYCKEDSIAFIPGLLYTQYVVKFACSAKRGKCLEDVNYFKSHESMQYFPDLRIYQQFAYGTKKVDVLIETGFLVDTRSQFFDTSF